jgi:protocatechuate 3,4-dioxygenase beta subunit
MSAIGRIKPRFILWLGLLLAVVVIGLFLASAVRWVRARAAAAPQSSLPSAHSVRPVPIFGLLRLLDGRPAVGQSVAAAYANDSHGSSRVIAIAVTDKYGAFAFSAGLEPGIYTISAIGPEGSRAAWPLVVRERPYIVLDLRVKTGALKASPRSTGGEWRTVIFGIVTRPDGLTPVSSKSFVVVENSKTSRGSQNGDGSALAGKSGAFVLPRALGPGAYTITAMNAPIIARVNYVVPRNPKPYMVLIVKAGSGSMTGCVLDAAGGPVAGAGVGLFNGPRRLAYSTTAGKSGHYVIDNVVPGQYSAQVCSPAPPGSVHFELMTEPVTIKKGQLKKNFTLRAGRRLPTPNRPYAAPTGKGSISGRVVDSKGHPVVDGTIFLSNDPEGLAYEATTGKDGRYAIKHIPPGQYIADAFGPRSPEFVELAASLGAAVAGHAPVDLKKMAAAEAAASKNWEGVTDVVVAITNAGLEKNFTLRKLRPGEYKAPVGSGSMGGRVLDSAGHPAVGAYVCLTNTAMNLGYHAITDKDGRYLIRRVLPARYVAEVTPPVPPGLMRVRVLTPAMPAELGMLKGISEVVRIRRGQLKEDFTLQKLVPAATIPAARATGAARERGIVEACMVYAQGNGGRYPPDLAILVAHGYITPKALIDPNAGTTPADLSHLPFRQAHDVSVVARRIKGHCDFVYVGRGLTTKACAGAAGAAIIVVYEKATPSYRPVGRNVAFADGDAKWEAVSAIPGVFAANNAARRAAKLPVVRFAP